MATPTDADSFQEVVVQGRLHNQVTNNVLHFQSVGPTTLEDIIAAVIDCFRTALLPVLSNQFTVESIRAKTIAPVAGAEIIAYYSSNNVGGAAGDSLPSMCAAVISKRSAFAGKQNRGRFYLPGLTEASTSQSKIIDPALAGLIAFCLCMAGKFIDNPGTSPAKLIVLSRRKLAATNNNYSQSFVFVQTLVPQPVIGTMRSRRIGHGT